MRTLIQSGVRIDYPNSVAFMYSRQPVIVTFLLDGGAGVTSVDIKLTCVTTGRSHTESRAPYSSSVEIDISRIMQLLATDVDQLTDRVEDGASLSEPFTLEVAYTKGQATTQQLTAEIIGMYGALDQGEIYGENTQRRLWLNFPQTFNLWTDDDDSQGFIIFGEYVFANLAPTYPCNEYDLMLVLRNEDHFDFIEKLRTGAPCNLGITWRSKIAYGAEIPMISREIRLIPDCRTDGTYLRWLNRRGELSYWLFTESKLRVTTSLADTFTRYYQGDPTIPESDIFRNPQKASYREAREMVLGAVGLSRDEYDDLCDLATSPVVERLMPGTNQTMWQRVNVVAGTFERDIRRKTPNRQDLEIIIELPERNTIKL